MRCGCALIVAVLPFLGPIERPDALELSEMRRRGVLRIRIRAA